MARRSYVLLTVATALSLGVGYMLLSLGPPQGCWSRTVAPVVLVLGYCLGVPAAILALPCRRSDTTRTADP